MTAAIGTEPLATPAAPALTQQMTYEEFLAWADGDTYTEWVNGKVVYMSPVSNEHQAVGLFLLNVISCFVEAHNLGIIRYDPFQMKTGPNLPGRAPDILFVATPNLSRLKSTYLDGPADLVVEIISPDSRARDRGEKFYEYEQGGVREYWLIDPLRKQSVSSARINTWFSSMLLSPSTGREARGSGRRGSPKVTIGSEKHTATWRTPFTVP
jgi:Uma2 family endonuclease